MNAKSWAFIQQTASVRRAIVAIAFLTAAALASRCFGQTTLSGASAVFKSTGYASGGDWVLNGDGYLGTFIHLDSPGTVQLTLDAAGTFAGGDWPLMDLHVGDQKATWSVNSTGFSDYTVAFDLPAGTHALRTEFVNDYSAGSQDDRNLTVRSLSVNGPGTGAAVWNSTSDAVIADGADTYIESFRKGPARVVLEDPAGTPLPAGMPVQVQLRSHAFHFGSAVAGTALSDGFLMVDNPTPGSDAYNYQQALKRHFNMLQPERAGGWRWNEEVRGVPTMDYVDRITTFAEQNGMDTRMTGLLYAGGLRPSWVQSLEDLAVAGDAAAKADLRSAISDRVDYFVRDRITRYEQLNGINESYHKPMYTELYGLDGIADIYNEMIDAARSVGSNAEMEFNEFGVLGRYAQYGEWYRQHIEDVIAAGIPSENRDQLRVGIENYTNSSKHGLDFIHRGLQTMKWLELPMTLTEFGVDTDDPNAPQILLDNMRLVFGSDLTDGFLVWGFWQPRMWQPKTGAAFYDADWNLTDSGKVYEQLLGIEDWGLPGVPTWTTEEALATDEGGAVDFRGFYGDYDVTVGDATYSLGLAEGTGDYELTIVPDVGYTGLDIDDNGRADALTDGVLILRRLFGFSGDALTEDAVSAGGGRIDPAEVADYLDAYRGTMLDVDDNGRADALTDGVVILRYLFGFNGDALTEDAVDPLGARTDPDEIVAFLDGYLAGVSPTSPDPALYRPLMQAIVADASIAPAQVPEPPTLVLAALAAAMFGLWMVRKA